MVRVFEKSAGGIVYKKTNGVCSILLLERLNASGSREYVLPKGHIEEMETAKETALREISEETGLAAEQLSIIKFITKISYTFVASHKNGNPMIDKDVYLFLVRYTGTSDPRIPPREHARESFVGFGWFDIEALRTMNIKPDVYRYIKKNIQYM